ncbi:type VI secretion system-associated protein VasI [Halomonas dongshanensis]|uniref:Type VI secretion system-associated protein TagO n=1 Tax=Halomonas dongshanensis TaxID=2890835 RepID=A0ABT2EGV6_9GAMM|nr:type VI secretion system-associated protein VasI [Halomonas dongshanensis]MCS2610811.1 type VI secretion system-associated protein TagO [Halomonas dongshanensis]
MKRLWKRLLLPVALLAATSAAADDQALVEAARQCSDEPSRLDRLGCYDALFDTRAALETTDTELPALWHAIARQESERGETEGGLLVSTPGEDVLLSTPALGTTPPRPVLVMACEKVITRFQLHMPTPIDATRVPLELVADGQSVPLDWRARDDGYVISGGRGLPAIDTLRPLLGASEFTLRSDLPELDGLRFDVTDLRQRIQPLRSACRW